jgi:hypothetical protein
MLSEDLVGGGYPDERVGVVLVGREIGLHRGG